uniref:G-protein coupled receptors family 2 profile 2 domain-containing protein n=1 Tax=Glossina brevipalpis TaxID=37001 RepID=A0A1A9WQK3_9MUSC
MFSFKKVLFEKNFNTKQKNIFLSVGMNSKWFRFLGSYQMSPLPTTYIRADGVIFPSASFSKTNIIIFYSMLQTLSVKHDRKQNDYNTWGQNDLNQRNSDKKQNLIADQKTIGWLGIAIFFHQLLVRYSLILINRRNVYDRIQHKLRANLIMFALILLVMTINWLFLCLSSLLYEGLLYAHIIINALQGPLLLYICVIRQTHVTFLLKKSCCYNKPPAASDSGDEMHYMNGNNY